MPGWFQSSLAEKNVMRLLSAHFFRTLAFVLLLIAVSYSQPPTDEDHDVILLKDGGIARGRIVELVCGDYVVMEVSGGKTIKIIYDDIRLITDKKHYDESEGKLRGDCVKERGVDFEYVFRIGLLKSDTSTHFSSSFIVGPRMARSFFAGMSIGWDRFTFDMFSARIHTCVFGNLIKDADGNPETFLHFSAGYGHNIKDKGEMVSAYGPNYSLSIGGAFAVEEGTALTIEAGYHYQTFKHTGISDFNTDYFTMLLGVRF